MNTGIFECYEKYRLALRWPFFELAHSDVCDWRLVIWERPDGIGEGAPEIEILDVQYPDLDYVLAQAEVKFKKWLWENKNIKEFKDNGHKFSEDKGE